jgi:hypothetical protein
VTALTRAVVVAAGIALLPGPAAAQDLSIEFAKKARIVESGGAAIVDIRAICPPGEEILEAFVYLGQDGFSSDFAFFGVACDGEWHALTLRVPATEDFRFHKGKAQASGYLLLTNDTSTSPVARVKLK